MQPEKSSDAPSSKAPAPSASPRLALVIGNARYARVGLLRTAAHDAEAIAARLIELGFTVRLELDLGCEQLRDAVAAFVSELAMIVSSGRAGTEGTTAFVYFAGHAAQVRGENFLLPVDGAFDTETDVEQQAVAVSRLLASLRASATNAIVLLDCCRPNPMPWLVGPSGQSRTLTVHQGLAEATVPRGALLAFATQPDAIAEEGKGRSSPFAEALIKYLDLPDATVAEMLSHVRRHVAATTGGHQVPWDRSALVNTVMLRPVRCRRQVPLEQILADEQAEAGRASEYWALVERTPNTDLIRSFLHQFPRSPHRPAAMARLDAMRWEGLRRRALRRAGAVLLALIGIALSWAAIEYSRFTDLDGMLDGTVIVGNDIGIPGYDMPVSSLSGCRVRCIVSPSCTALTFTPLPARPGTIPTGGTCALKTAAVSVAPVAAVRHVDRPRSEVVRRRGTELPRLLPEGSRLVVDRTLTGEPVARERVLARAPFPGPDGRSALREDPPTAKFHWHVTGTACHQRCMDLGGDCKGYSYTALGQRCSLFRTVKGIARDSDGTAVHTPSVHSVCLDKSVADCGPSR